MEKLKNLLRPSLVVFTFAACTAVAGCGGTFNDAERYSGAFSLVSQHRQPQRENDS